MIGVSGVSPASLSARTMAIAVGCLLKLATCCRTSGVQASAVSHGSCAQPQASLLNVWPFWFSPIA